MLDHLISLGFEQLFKRNRLKGLEGKSSINNSDILRHDNGAAGLISTYRMGTADHVWVFLCQILIWKVTTAVRQM